MGRASVHGLSEFWVRLLYAKGKLSIQQAVGVVEQRLKSEHLSEEQKQSLCVSASEGLYDDPGTIGMALEDIVCFLACKTQQAVQRFWGYRGLWEGPYILPCLSITDMAPKGFRMPQELRSLVLACWHAYPSLGVGREACRTQYGVAGDYLEDLGHPEWAAYVREIPDFQGVVIRYVMRNDPIEDDLPLLDRLAWKFAPGWRKKYSEIPLLSQISN